MTLTELHARLGQMIEENNQRGQADRNDLPVCLQLNRSRRNRVKSRYFKADIAWAARHRVGDTVFGLVLEADESDEVSPERSLELATR